MGFLVTLAPQVNIFIAAPIAGFGALISDLFIFQFIRTSFQEEFNSLKLKWIFIKIRELFFDNFSDKLKEYILWTIAGFLIASPFPDEFGVALVSGFTKIDKKIFSIVAFILNTLGILFILAISR